MTDRKRINVYIPMEIYVKVTRSDYNLTDAIVKGLDLLLSDKPKNEDTVNKQLYERITDLQEQIRVHSIQLETKDTQIGKLTETMQAQAIHIQTLLNQKQIEMPGAKKPWWQFW